MGGAGRPPLTPPFRSLQQQNNLPDSSGNRRPQETNPQETSGSPTPQEKRRKSRGPPAARIACRLCRRGQPAPRKSPFWGATGRGVFADNPLRGAGPAAQILAVGGSWIRISRWLGPLGSREFPDFPEISGNSRKFPGISGNARKVGSPGPTPHASETVPTCPYTSFWGQRFRIQHCFAPPRSVGACSGFALHRAAARVPVISHDAAAPPPPGNQRGGLNTTWLQYNTTWLRIHTTCPIGSTGTPGRHMDVCGGHLSPCGGHIRPCGGLKNTVYTTPKQHFRNQCPPRAFVVYKGGGGAPASCARLRLSVHAAGFLCTLPALCAHIYVCTETHERAH